MNDPYYILKIEFNGIKDVVLKYTSDGLICNYINQLEESLKEDYFESVKYCVDKIVDWYKANINSIRLNSYVYNYDTHVKTKEMLESINNGLKTYDFSKIKEKKRANKANGKSVFIVHGHDSMAKTEVARMIEGLDLKSVILHEQPDQGKTIIEKLEKYTADASFGVVLYTECDIGRAKDADEIDSHYRARQNVVFEHGLFIGALGRDKVCALVKGDVEKPGDLDGVVYIKMDDSGGWKIDLCKNMKAAGLEIDMNKLTK